MCNILKSTNLVEQTFKKGEWIMKKYSLILFLAVFIFPVYGYAVPPPPETTCPCDDTQLSNGQTGNDLIASICPDGVLGPDSSFILEPDDVSVTNQEPFENYSALIVGDNKTCGINADGATALVQIINDQEFELCRQRIVAGCGLTTIRPIPTLSEWGLIAMAGVLGLIGFLAIRRKAAV